MTLLYSGCATCTEMTTARRQTSSCVVLVALNVFVFMFMLVTVNVFVSVFVVVIVFMHQAKYPAEYPVEYPPGQISTSLPLGRA